MSVNLDTLETFLLTRPAKNSLCRPAIFLHNRPNFLAPHIMALLIIDNGLFD